MTGVPKGEKEKAKSPDLESMDGRAETKAKEGEIEARTLREIMRARAAMGSH